MILSKDIPGGNIRVISQNGNDITLEEEQRDSKNPWFYWKFKAVFDQPGEYRFRFTNPNKVGPRSAAVSRDLGLSWNWLSNEPHEDSQGFTFTCLEPGEYWFCQCMPYMQTDFERFAAGCKNNPYFSVSVVGTTKKSRAVELVTVKDGEPAQSVFFAARHHAQESMASYALEGILKLAMSDDPFAVEFRRKFALYAVPFVDKDGVEDGDQGKGRIPRDHARDYDGQSLYPEITSIRAFLKKINPVFSLDMHCPWIRYASNEYTYMTEGANPLVTMELERFADILERESPECAPFRAADILRWGVDWNVRANSLTGTMPGYGLKGFISAELDSENCYAQTVEIPFANFREKTVTPKEIRLYGESLLRTVVKYLDAVKAEKQSRNEVHTATIGFAGEVSGAASLDPAVCKCDYCTGFSDAVFFGDNADSSLPQDLKRAGVDLIVTAGPHCLDLGYEGLYQSLYKVEHAGLAHVGTARSVEEREKLRMPSVNGIRVAFIGYSAPFDKLSVLQEDEAGFAVNVLPENALPDALSAEIGLARRFQADFVVALVDFGSLSPDAVQSLTEQLKTGGVDLVVGKNEPAHMVMLRKENGRTVLVK